MQLPGPESSLTATGAEDGLLPYGFDDMPDPFHPGTSFGLLRGLNVRDDFIKHDSASEHVRVDDEFLFALVAKRGEDGAGRDDGSVDGYFWMRREPGVPLSELDCTVAMSRPGHSAPTSAGLRTPP